MNKRRSPLERKGQFQETQPRKSLFKCGLKAKLKRVLTQKGRYMSAAVAVEHPIAAKSRLIPAQSCMFGTFSIESRTPCG